MTAATPTAVSALFTEYYTANPITSTTVVSAFNDTAEPAYADITDSDNATNFEQQVAVSNYSQALTLSTDESITTQWGITWAMVFQSASWTATGIEVYTQYFAPKYATDSAYANYICQADNADNANTPPESVVADGATVSWVMQSTTDNWETNLATDQALSSGSATTVTEVSALGTAFTYTDTPTDAWTYGSVAVDDTADFELVFTCVGVRPVTAASTGLIDLAEGALAYVAGAVVYTAEDDLTVVYQTGADTADSSYTVVQGAASLAAAATAVAVSLALF